MENIINKLLDFFLNKPKSFGLKTGVVILVMGLILIADYGLGFSYSLSVENKIKQLTEIKKLEELYKDDTVNFIKIRELEQQVLSKKHYSDYINTDVFDYAKSDKNIEGKTSSGKNTPSLFWMIMSSSYSLVLLLPMLVVIPLLSGDRYDKNMIVGWGAMLFIWMTIIAFITLISYQIPLIMDNPLYNYILNSILHTALLVYVYKFFDNK